MLKPKSRISLSETIEHVQSSSEEDLEVLEASAEVAAATSARGRSQGTARPCQSSQEPSELFKIEHQLGSILSGKSD